MTAIRTFLSATALAWPMPGWAEDGLAGSGAQCLELAGAATAEVPASATIAASHRTALAAAAEVCAEAATADDPQAAVLFHAAAVAQARGDAAGAFALFERAAEAGLAAAETRLGDFYTFGLAPGGENATKAVEHYQRAAEMGDAAGKTTLALLYRIGRGVPRDSARMVELLTSAAEAGYHFAQYRLAQTYLTGEGIPGRADAGLGIPDTAIAMRYFTEAADAGNLVAALELAELYGDPTSGLPDDPDEQARLVRMVAETGEPKAVAAMGLLYETGRGVAQDPAVAAGLYVKALESGELAIGDLRRGAWTEWDRATAIEFQKILRARGLYSGPLDGIVGGGTAAGAAKLAKP